MTIVMHSPKAPEYRRRLVAREGRRGPRWLPMSNGHGQAVNAPGNRLHRYRWERPEHFHEIGASSFHNTVNGASHDYNAPRPW